MKTKLLIILVLVLGLLTSCAPKPVHIPRPELKSKFYQHQKHLEQIKSFLLKGSVNLFSKTQSHRLIYTCVGNFKNIRLTLSSSLGQIFSIWQREPNRLIAFFPYQKIAYISSNPDLQLANFANYPLPFNLKQSVNLLLGKTPATLQNSKDLLLNPDGSVKQIKIHTYQIKYLNYVQVQKWKLPAKVTIIGPNQFKLIIYQKKIIPNFNCPQLNLNLPPQIEVYAFPLNKSQGGRNEN